MSTNQEPRKDAQFFVRPATKDTTAESLARQISEGLIAIINEERAKKGLPPLEKD